MQPHQPFNYRRAPGVIRSLHFWLFLIIYAVATPAIGQAPPISVRFEPGCEAVKAYFTNNVAGIAYEWNFGDGSSSNISQPVHEFPFGSIISVTLTVDQGNGDQQVYALDVSTPPAPVIEELTLPNVFSPNGDGVNDVFGPITDHFLGPCSQLSIYNRFGQLLFDGAGNNVMWDGRTFAGEKAVAGTYFYVFQVNGREFTGYLSLHL